MLVSFGQSSGAAPALDPLALSKRGSLYLTRPTLGTYVATREELLASAGTLFDLVTRNALRIDIGQRFALADAAAAHRALESRLTHGPTILAP